MVDELLRAEVYRKIIITPKDIRNYYKDHADEFSEEGEMSFRQILIKFSTYETKEEGKSVADELLERLKNGEDFVAIAKENSKGPHAEKEACGRLMK